MDDFNQDINQEKDTLDREPAKESTFTQTGGYTNFSGEPFYPAEEKQSETEKTQHQDTNDQGSNAYQWDFSNYSYPGNTANTPPREKTKKKKGRIVLSIIGTLLGVAVLGFAGYGVFSLIDQYGVSITNPQADSGRTNVPDLTINDRPSSSASASSSGGVLSTPEIAKKVKPSVVGVVQYKKSQPFVSSGEGSGIIISTDGYIVTNNHVIEGADGVKVVLDSNQEFEAKVIGTDSISDLAVIKIEGSNLIAAEFGNSKQLQVGESVVAIGNPSGMQLAGSVTQGIISALDRPITNKAGISINCIQTDAAINPGNSGGALVNTSGQVVGINSLKIANVDYEGIGFAISIADAKPIIDDLLQYGYVKGRVKLGVSVSPVDEVMVRIYGVPRGLYIAAVEKGTDAEKKGLIVGDIITKVDGNDVAYNDDLLTALYKHKPGESVTLTIYRANLQGRATTLNVTVVLEENKPSSSATP